jgi:hypothetical protein
VVAVLPAAGSSAERGLDVLPVHAAAAPAVSAMIASHGSKLPAPRTGGTRIDAPRTPRACPESAGRSRSGFGSAQYAGGASG